MRSFLPFIIGFAVLSLAIPTITHISQNQIESRDLSIFDTKSSTASSTDLISRDHEIQKRWFSLIWTTIRAAWALTNVRAVAKASWGTYKLATNIYSFKKDCTGEGVKVYDCLITLSTAAVDIFTGVYLFKDGIKARGVKSGYATLDHPSIPGLITVAHIPVINGTLWRASISSGNNGTWKHHATSYHEDGTEIYHVLYRLAHPDDLGFQNNGSYHHYRVQSANYTSSNTTKRNDEGNNAGVVFDYVWENEEYDIWEEMKDDMPGDPAGKIIGKWMEDNNAEATCAVPIFQYTADGQSRTQTLYGDQGVMAYGWNNKPFNFNGRLGGWIGGCGGSESWS